MVYTSLRLRVFSTAFRANSFLASGYKFEVMLSKENTILVHINLLDDEVRRYFVDMTNKSILETQKVIRQNVFS